VDPTGQQARPYPFGEIDRLELHPEYSRLRDEGKPVRVLMPYGGQAWLVVTYHDVKTVLSDKRFSLAATFNRDVPRLFPLVQDQPSLVLMDPPEHTRLRKLVAGAFTNRRIEQLRPRIQQIVDDLLDRMVAKGQPADLIADFGFPLPITVICEMLGIPVEDRRRFRGWSDTVLALTSCPPDDIAAAIKALKAYFAELVASRREKPTNDLFGTLVKVRDEGDGLSEEELVVFAGTLLVAGHETTANLIGNSLYTLITHPDQFDRLKSDPTVLPAAIEELLRFIPARASVSRSKIAVEDVELSGVLIRAGDSVVAHLASANRDKTVFDRPDELDLARQVNPHVTFGPGIHHCLGAQLTRLELQVALGSLLKRLPNPRFAVPVEDVEASFKRGHLLRGLTSLPIAW